MKTSIITFGEIMGRLSTPGFARFRQALPGSLHMTFAGAEANVAASIALLGGQASFVTALPNSAIASGLVFALTTPELSEPNLALRFAVATSCLAHSIEGDFNYCGRSEVEALMGGSASGRVVR